MYKKDMLIGIAVICIFTFVYLVLIPIGIGVPSRVPHFTNSPAFFPKLITAILIFLGFVMFIQGLLRYRIEKRNIVYKSKSADISSDQDTDEEAQFSRKYIIFKTISIIILLFVLVESVKLLGILLTSVIFYLIFSILYGERRYKTIIPIAIVLPLILSVFFTNVANIPLPQGIFGF